MLKSDFLEGPDSERFVSCELPEGNAWVDDLQFLQYNREESMKLSQEQWMR